MKAEAIDLSIAAAGSKATYVGAGVTGLGWFLSNRFFGLMGVLIAIAGLLMNWHYKRKAERIVKRCANVPMYQHEFDAFVSLAFNVGAGAKGVKDGFCTLKSGAPSTISRLLNTGDYVGACAALLDWGNYKGKPLRGLMLRREREYRQCMGPALTPNGKTP